MKAYKIKFSFFAEIQQKKRKKEKEKLESSKNVNVCFTKLET